MLNYDKNVKNVIIFPLKKKDVSIPTRCILTLIMKLKVNFYTNGLKYDQNDHLYPQVVFETSSAFLRLAKTEVGGIHGQETARQVRQIYDEFQEQLVTFDKCPYDVLEPDAQVRKL